MKWTAIPKILSVDVELLSDVVNYIGSNYFDIAFLHAMNRVAHIVEITGFAYEQHKPPTAAGWTGVRADTINRVEGYIKQYYRYDPILKELPERLSERSSLVRVVPKSSIEDTDYRSMYFENPNFQTEVVLATKQKVGWHFIKFYLEKADLKTTTAYRIGELGAVIYPLARRHAFDTDDSLREETRPKVLDRLIFRLGERFPMLTDRERQVCALTILGNSAQKIGETIKISPNTVITYRRRAYERLGVSSASNLMVELI